MFNGKNYIILLKRLLSYSKRSMMDSKKKKKWGNFYFNVLALRADF
jgi:hypothetical protein